MDKPARIVTDSMIGMKLPDYARHSPRVATVLGHNPSPFTGPGTNTYLVGDGDLAVIDPGPAIASHVEAVLAAGAGRIKLVLCTPHHPDHSPAAAAIREATGAQLIGRPAPPGVRGTVASRPGARVSHLARRY